MKIWLKNSEVNNGNYLEVEGVLTSFMFRKNVDIKPLLNNVDSTGSFFLKPDSAVELGLEAPQYNINAVVVMNSQSNPTTKTDVLTYEQLKLMVASTQKSYMKVLLDNGEYLLGMNGEQEIPVIIFNVRGNVVDHKGDVYRVQMSLMEVV